MGKVRHLVTVFLAFITVVSGSVLHESSQKGLYQGNERLSTGGALSQ